MSLRLPRLARNAAVYIAVPASQRALHFFLIPVFTRFLAPDEYGAWGYVTVVATLIGTVAPLGLLSTYFYALRRIEGWPRPAIEIRRASLQLALLLVGVMSLLAFWPLRRISLGLQHPDSVWAMVLAATVVGFAVQAMKRRYQMLEDARAYVRVEVASGLTVAIASVIGVVILRQGVLGLAIGLLAGALAGLAVNPKALSEELHGSHDRVARRAALTFGLPLFVHAAAAVLLQYIDRFMLERMSSLDELGLYSLAGQLGTAMLLLTTSTNQAYLPFLYGTVDEDTARAARGERAVALFFTLAGAAGAFLAPVFIRYLVDPRYFDSRLPAQILIVSGVFHGYYFLMVGRLMLARRTVAIAAATVTAMAANILLNLWLIPRYQATGAAWATLTSEVLLAALVALLAQGALRRPAQDRIPPLA